MINYDPDKNAIFGPCNLNFEKKYKCALMIFDDEVWEDYVLRDVRISSFSVKNSRGRVFDTYRSVVFDGEDVLLISPNVGGAASAVDLELLIASGVEKVVAFGTCGAMDKEIAKNTIIIPEGAIREEGVSYHYLPPGEEVAQSRASVETLMAVFSENDVAYRVGKTWTTDAVYRETAKKMKIMKERGCIVVDMEMASLFAVAEFRGFRFAGFLISDDNIDGRCATEDNSRDSMTIFRTALCVVTRL